MPGSGKERVAGPSTKRVRVTSPSQGKSATVEDDWRQCVVDTLEITNTEWHAMQTQLKGVHQVWEAANIELCSIRGQLRGINWELEYLARMVWKRYMATQGGLVSG